MKIIDFHTHFDKFWWDKHHMPLSEKTFLDDMETYGITISNIFTVEGLYTGEPMHNDALAEAARRSPDKLYPFLTVDPKRGAEAVTEIERCIKMKIFRGVKFHPWLQAFAPNTCRATLIQVVELAASAGLPVLFHDGTPPYSTTYQIAQVARWVPQSKIVLGHAGICEYNHAAAHLVRDIPNLYGCICGPKPGDVRHIVNLAGEDKIVWGSDTGFVDGRAVAERRAELEYSGITERQIEKIYYHNAVALLG